MLLHYITSNLSRYCWSLLILVWLFHVPWRPVPTTPTKSKIGCAMRWQWCLWEQDNKSPWLCWHLPCLFRTSAASFPSSPFLMEKMAGCPPCTGQGWSPSSTDEGCSAPSGSLAASSSQHHCYSYHQAMQANRKHNRLTQVLPLVIDDLSWLSQLRLTPPLMSYGVSCNSGK